MSIDRVRLLLAQEIGGERVLFAPVNLATFEILLLLSYIIYMIHMAPFYWKNEEH